MSSGGQGARLGEEVPDCSLPTPDLQTAANQADVIFVKDVQPLLPKIKITAIPRSRSRSRSPFHNSQSEICRLQQENKMMRRNYAHLVMDEERARSLMVAELTYYKNKLEQQKTLVQI